MLPSASELTYFLEVTQTRNISRAAERLGITQPTLSVAMRKLEENLKTTLLVRSKTGVQMTKAGSRFAAQARLLLDQWEKVRAETLREESEIRGRFVLGCHVSVAQYSLPLFLPKLLRENEALEIELQHELSRKITERVISFQIDFGIVVNPVAHPDLVIVRLCKDEVTFWKGGRSGNSETLFCDPDLIQVQTLLRKARTADLNFTRTVSTSSLELIANLVSEGAGVGILPSRVATQDRYKNLVVLNSNAPTFLDEVCLIYRIGTQKSRAATTIMSAIKMAFQGRDGGRKMTAK